MERNMKKLSLLILSFIFAISLIACSTSNIDTNVRVKSISYKSNESSNVNVSFKSLIQLTGSKKISDDEPIYIFPNDVLTFTIELEDPNFEFISLLSVTFNNQVIRANVNNAIFETRDCGLNICIDFPFLINANVKTYRVDEVKFAKLSSDSGISALIDRNSVNTITLDIYNEAVFPYVTEAISMLNDMVSDLSFYLETDIEKENWNYFINQRQLQSSFVILKAKQFFEEGFTYQILGSGIFEDEGEGPVEVFDSFNIPNCCGIGQNINISFWNQLWDEENQKDIFLDYQYMISFFYIHKKYEDIFFYHEGNKIYVNILGSNYFLVEFYNDMRLKKLSDYQ
jgi:hypothetical protein